MKIVVALATVVALSAPACAQNGSSPASASAAPSADAQAQSQNLTQQIRQQLESAGLKDVKVVPQSFLVEAKDQNNNTVHMAINGNSIMAVTDVSSTVGSSSSSNGSSSGNSNSGMTGSSSPSSSSSQH